jgi:phospholipid/cholesterol/gamma-HCH transport system substrate-binding protein
VSGKHVKYSNELKVGFGIVAAIVIFTLGLRFFQDVPLFAGSYELHARVDDARGLIPGNPVRTNGVKIGSIKAVSFDQSIGAVDILFRVNKGVVFPEGTVASISGLDGLTGVRMEIEFGPSSNPPIPAGGIVPNADEADDFIGDMASRAPVLLNRVDSVLTGLNGTIGSVEMMLGEPNSDINAILGSLRGSASKLNKLLGTEQERISSILTNVEAVTSDLSGITSSQADSIARSVELLNQSLQSLDRSMAALEGTTNKLDGIIAKIDTGEGTLGLLINDPGLYRQLDSLAANLNGVLVDFKSNPRRYLREMKLVDIF